MINLFYFLSKADKHICCVMHLWVAKTRITVLIIYFYFEYLPRVNKGISETGHEILSRLIIKTSDVNCCVVFNFEHITVMEL